MHTDYLANIPSPPQGVWHLGPIPVRAYALCIITGILVALWLTLRRYRARGGDPDMVWDSAIVVIIAGVIGGRAYHVISHWPDYFGEDAGPWAWAKITEGGLAIIGAVLLGGLAIWVFYRTRGVPVAPFADAVAPGLILAQGIGRFGNWFNQELYGRPTDVPWALDLYYRVDADGNFAPLTGRSTGEVIASVHPTFLYESLWNVGAFLLLLSLDRHLRLGHGRVFALYLVIYGLGRSWVELMRTDPAQHILGMRVNSFAALVCIVIGLVAFLLLPRGRESEKEVLGDRPAPDTAESETPEEIDDAASGAAGADRAVGADAGETGATGEATATARGADAAGVGKPTAGKQTRTDGTGKDR